MMDICVYGNTHYAWVTAAKLAEKGNQVSLCLAERSGDAVAFDASREWLLPQLLDEQRQAGRLRIETGGTGAGRVHLMADDYTAETLRAALQPVVAAAAAGDTFILVLTPLPLGTLQEVQAEIDAAHAARAGRVYLAALPLFIREGTALADFERPQLFLLGSQDKAVIDCVKDFMRPFMRQAAEVMVVPEAAAELIKYGINAMLATRISFMNEMAALAEKVGVDIELVRQGMAADPRVGRDYLQAGCGFGGPSFSGDLLSFARTMKQELDTAGLIDAVLAINESQKEILFRKIWRFFRGDLAGRTVAVWGAAFKPGTSSVSNSVVHPLLQALWAQGCRTRVYDPLAMDALKKVYPAQPLLEYAGSVAASVVAADAIAVVTAWDEFWSPDFAAMAAQMRTAVVFDGRNLYEPEQMQTCGFRYFGIGHGESI
jgi:UDPglucose 6-dehydrogenase